jgi:hypothetical protein
VSEAVFAPDRGWTVRIIDLSGASEDNIVEEVPGFPTLPLANAFCRAYVRDSLERCRIPGQGPRETLAAWFAFGEDAEVIDAGDEGWKSANELDDFANRAGSEIERDWRSIDPRRQDADPDDLDFGEDDA